MTEAPIITNEAGDRSMTELVLDLTPTWSAVLPILTNHLENGTGNKTLAREELARMARLADRFVYLLQILPESTLRQMRTDVENFLQDGPADETADALTATITNALEAQGARP